MQFTIDDYPRVDGSTSTHPLGVLIACKVLGVPYKWQAEVFDETRRIVPDDSAPDTSEVAGELSQKIIHNGTHGAYVNLIDNRADLILVARLPSDDELQQASDNGVQLESHAVALDAFVFILNIENSITSLSIQQIRDIYTGKMINWTEVGGSNEEIHAYQRDANSGSQELMKTMVMQDQEMIDAPAMVLEGMMGPINVISEDTLGIGYSVYFYEQFMAPNEKLKLCAVDGITPGADTIGQKSYPLVTEVYAVIRTELDTQSNAFKLREWLLTAEGQGVVEESGYVPVQ